MIFFVKGVTFVVKLLIISLLLVFKVSQGCHRVSHKKPTTRDSL